MNKIVTQELKQLRLLSDTEIMKIYVRHLTSGFPTLDMFSALETVMNEKKIVAQEMSVVFNFLDSTGKARIIQLRETENSL